MATKIYVRRGTRAEILEIVPEDGEPVWATDTRIFYMGDGTTSGGVFVAGGSAGVSSLNALLGVITVAGTGIVSVTETGQAIIISGELHSASHTDGTDDIQDAAADGSTKGITTFFASDFDSSAGAISLSDTRNIESELASDGDYSGFICSGVAGETLVFSDVVYYNSSAKWVKTIASVPAQTKGHIGLVSSGGAAEANIEILLEGFMREDDWDWGTVGAELFIDTTSGVLTDSIPTVSGESVRKVAVAHTADSVWFNPAMSPVILRT